MLGENIRKYRKEAGLDQKELADKLGVTMQAVSSWETGRTEPRMGTIEEVCKIFKITKQELIDGERLVSDLTADEQILIEKIRLYDYPPKRLVKYMEYLLDLNNEEKKNEDREKK